MTRPVAATRLLVLTDRRQLPAGRDLVGTIARCAAADVDTVVLRELDLPERERAALATELARHVTVVSARTLLPGAVGVHLAAGQPTTAGCHGRSCHDGPELARAAASGAAYVTLSPVGTSASKPRYGPALGTDGLRDLLPAAGPVPVFALGGVDADSAAELRAAGAHGVAVMGAVMRADDPAAVVARLLEAVS